MKLRKSSFGDLQPGLQDGKTSEQQIPNYPSATPTRLLPCTPPPVPPSRCFWGNPGAATRWTQKDGQHCTALWCSARLSAGWRADFGVFPLAVRPKSGPEG